ncbi:1232_t:CDS:1, partial [Gigaspora rosea]
QTTLRVLTLLPQYYTKRFNSTISHTRPTPIQSLHERSFPGYNTIPSSDI